MFVGFLPINCVLQYVCLPKQIGSSLRLCFYFLIKIFDVNKNAKLTLGFQVPLQKTKINHYPVFLQRQ